MFNTRLATTVSPMASALTYIGPSPENTSRMNLSMPFCWQLSGGDTCLRRSKELRKRYSAPNCFRPQSASCKSCKARMTFSCFLPEHTNCHAATWYLPTCARSWGRRWNDLNGHKAQMYRPSILRMFSALIWDMYSWTSSSMESSTLSANLMSPSSSTINALSAPASSSSELAPAWRSNEHFWEMEWSSALSRTRNETMVDWSVAAAAACFNAVGLHL